VRLAPRPALAAVSLAFLLVRVTQADAQSVSAGIPPAPTSGPAHLRPAARVEVPCGPGAARAARALDLVARTGRLDAEGQAALRDLVTGGESVGHADLAVLALAVADEQAWPLEGVTTARRDALLDAVMAPAIPRSACLPGEALVRLRARLLVGACAELQAGPVPVAQWGQAPARPLLLLLERVGPTIPESCRRVLRRELGDAAEMGPPRRPIDAPPDGLGSALVPPPAADAPAAGDAAPR
jgi:hypothetical protein